MKVRLFDYAVVFYNSVNRPRGEYEFNLAHSSQDLSENLPQGFLLPEQKYIDKIDKCFLSHHPAFIKFYIDFFTSERREVLSMSLWPVPAELPHILDMLCSADNQGLQLENSDII